jgi:hypothetical protein
MSNIYGADNKTCVCSLELKETTDIRIAVESSDVSLKATDYVAVLISTFCTVGMEFVMTPRWVQQPDGARLVHCGHLSPLMKPVHSEMERVLRFKGAVPREIGIFAYLL